MPARKRSLTPEEQRKRFEEEVERRQKAGLLDPKEAAERLDSMVRKSIKDQGA